MQKAKRIQTFKQKNRCRLWRSLAKSDQNDVPRRHAALENSSSETLWLWVKTCEKPCNPLVNICQRQADKSGYINECSSLKLYGSIWYHSCHSFWSIPLALETLLRHNFCSGATNALMINCAASSPMASTQKSKFNRFFFLSTWKIQSIANFNRHLKMQKNQYFTWFFSSEDALGPACRLLWGREHIDWCS